MTETPETPTARISTAPTPTSTVPPRPNRVFQAAAWVAIAAGTVFIVAVVFFSGYVLGKHATFHGHFRHHKHHAHHAMFMPGHPRGGPGASTPAGPGAPGEPSGTAPGGPGQVPQSVAPSLAPSH